MIKQLQGYLAHQKLPPPRDHRRALGIGLLQDPRGVQFLLLRKLVMVNSSIDLVTAFRSVLQRHQKCRKCGGTSH